MSDQMLEAALLDAIARRERAHAEVIGLTGAWERRGVWISGGAACAADRLAHLANITRYRAANDLALGRALLDMPATQAAVASGQIGIDHVRELAIVRIPERAAVFAEHEHSLVDALVSVPAALVRRATRHWAALVDSLVDDRERRERIEGDRSLHVSEVGDLVIINGQLPVERGRVVIRAINALAGVGGPDDRRTATQRRADALIEIAEHALCHAPLPNTAGRRPHLNITVDARHLVSNSGLGFDDHNAPVGATDARRLACDATISRVATDDHGLVLDVGRTTRTVPPGTRTAIDLRDRHCQFPGCDRPVAWCDAHHIQHWADGGRTDRENLLLLCRRHHTQVHQSGVTIAGGSGAWTFHERDGTPITTWLEPDPTAAITRLVNEHVPRAG